MNMNSSTQVDTAEVNAPQVNAPQVPPVLVFVCAASLGSSASGNGLMKRVLPKKFERGVLYEA
jgi:mannitol-specific phosphotransferase system IIBC component